MTARLLSFPLLLVLAGISAVLMFLPALDALIRDDHSMARAFAYSGLLGLFVVFVIGLAISGEQRKKSGDLANLLSLFLAYTLLPLFMAIPFYEGLATTRFLNAYVEMVSCFTTTGATLFDVPGRLVDSLHLWRALVGWAGGLLIWVSASAVLAPLALGGFEVTASAEPGQGDTRLDRFERADAAKRIEQAVRQLAPIYFGLTAAAWLLLVISGERSFVALVHAMSTLATSGISSIGGPGEGSAGIAGEGVIFLFMFFALSRLTFSSDTLTSARPGLHHDPEFRLGVVLVLGVPMLLFLRHWFGAFEVDQSEDLQQGLRGLWGSIFTVLSFLSTTGFESADWDAAQDWSGLGTPGLILLGLALVGGGVATTAGGVKLLRVYTLYLNGQREMERLIHPSSVGRAGARSRRIRRQGAFIAWIFFMLFALSLALVTVLLAALGQEFEAALVLSIAALSTTGPLTSVAATEPVALLEMGAVAKLIFSAAMVVGRLETLAIIAVFNPALWRD
ncbi:MAG: potassium transporter TrkG [Roseovarius sp.]|nr:potassium transporter TrkG [Roseovarius sp.]